MTPHLHFERKYSLAPPSAAPPPRRYALRVTRTILPEARKQSGSGGDGALGAPGDGRRWGREVGYQMLTVPDLPMTVAT